MNIDQDSSRFYTITYENVVYNAETSDPYGLFRIKAASSGDLPRELEGQYTSLGECEKAIKSFVNKERLLMERALKEKEEMKAKIKEEIAKEKARKELEAQVRAEIEEEEKKTVSKKKES